MPLTALHPEHGLLDTTLDDLGAPIQWEDIHRTRPRPPLSCPPCGGGLHAKVSPLGLRYFAHDPRTSTDDCPVRHETVEHRTLKNEIARAIRQAGWRATVETAGNGWRADVLATSPDGERSMVWEVQLSAASVDDIARRTSKYTDDGHEICWVTTRDNAPWLCTVPSILIAPGKQSGWVVRDGHRKLADQPLANLHAVDSWGQAPDPHGLLGGRSLDWIERTGQYGPWHNWADLFLADSPAFGEFDVHDRVLRAGTFRCRIGWWRARPHGLFTFVAAIQKGQLLAVELAPPHRDTSRRGTTVVWTTWQYVNKALAYTAFALGWPVLHSSSVCPFPCARCPCARCGTDDQWVLDGGVLSRYHLCPTCDEDLTDIALDVYKWEIDTLQNDPERNAIALTTTSPLYYQPTR